MLSDDQEVARAAIHAAMGDGARRLTMSGPAGSGKTTLMRTLIDDLEGKGRAVTLLAPTGKAAARLRDLTGRDTSTIHRAIYKRIIEKPDGNVEFRDPRSAAQAGAVVICDEASMIGQTLYRDLAGALPASAVLICVGDREQLPPVNDTWGADFGAPTALLTKVHRQAETSPIIRLATTIRHGGDWRTIRPEPGYVRRRSNVAGAAGWLATMRALGVDATLLTFSNRTRAELNRATRAARGHVGELVVGDVIVCTRNAHALGIANGETRTVDDFGYTVIDRVADDGWEMEPWLDAAAVSFVEGGEALIFAEHLADGVPPSLWSRVRAEVDPRSAPRLMMAEFGEALTVHKSQGSQWDNVGVVYDSMLAGMAQRDPELHRRILYTAATRAAKELTIFEV
jgi:ATP-dependent exoDNAse (exonuclease V) alpha subunit